VARVAARQHGVVTFAQLLAAGLSEAGLRRRVARPSRLGLNRRAVREAEFLGLLVVETDGYRAHRGSVAIEGDRAKDDRLLARSATMPCASPARA
jgi:hypothetical protein